MVYRIFVGTYSDSVHALNFDPEGPSLTLVSTVTVGHHPSWITPHPADPSIIFSGLEQSDGDIVSIKYDEEGNGTVVGEFSSGGADPCTLVGTGNQLLVGNVHGANFLVIVRFTYDPQYSGGTFVAIPLTSEAPFASAVDSAVIQFTGAGPNETRQKSSHPHQVIPHPDRDEILVPDLGSDKTHRLAKDENGAWVEKGCVLYQPGGGPRHVAFHNGVLYTLLELTSEITSHRFPPLPEEPALIATVPTMQKFPPPPANLEMLAAEILIPRPNEAFPTPYMYVSNRNDPSPEGDVISIYSVADPDKVEPIAEVRSGLKHLRGMLFGGPDEKYLVAGGVNGPGVKVFERVDGGKGLREVAFLHVDAPTGFLWG